MSNLHSFLPELNSVAPFQGVSQRSLARVMEEEEGRAEQVVLAPVISPEELEFQRLLAERTEALEAKYAQDLQAARDVWVKELGGNLTALVSEAMADMEARVGLSLQQVMLPFVEKTIPKAALADFLQTVKLALQDDFKDALSLSGPADMVKAVKDALKAYKFKIECETTSGIELRAKCKDFVVSTRIAAWLDELHGASA